MQLITEKETAKRTSLTRGGINYLLRDNKFPKPVKLAEKRKAFVAAEVDEWIAQRIAARDAGRAA